MAGIPFLSKILALAGIGVKEQLTNKEVLINVNEDQTAGSIVTVELPSVSGKIPVKAEVVLASEKGANNGVATLDGSGKVPTTQLPPYSISEVFVVADQAARLALVAQVGDVAVQTDNSTTYILQTEPASVNGNWVVISATNAITSVNGQTGPGAVTIDADDVGAVPIDGHTPMTGALVVGPYGTATGETGAIRLKELTANGAYSVSLRSPDVLADDVILTLPDTVGSGGQYLKTTGGGVLTWDTITAGVTSITTPNGTNPKTGAVTLNAFEIRAVDTTGDTMTGALTMGPVGLLPGETGIIKFQELTIHGDNYVAFRAPDAIAGLPGTGVIWTLPGADGSANQALTTNGSGTLSWVAYAKSVNSQTPDGAGNISLTTTNVAEGTNLYFTNTRAQDAITGAASTIVTADLTINRALVSDASGKVAVSTVTSTELGYLSGVSSAIQTQINGKVSKSGDTMSGALVMGPIGTAAGDGGVIKFQELAANGTNFVALKAADSIAADVTWTLPATDGTARQALVTDGAGVLSWESGLLYLNYNGSTDTVYSHVNPAVTPGAGSTAYGYNALNLATGNYNVAVGPYAGESITTGTQNTLIGDSAGYDINGASLGNTAVGATALNGANATYTDNVAIGIGSIYYTGAAGGVIDKNVSIGANSVTSGKSDLTLQYNIVIGDSVAQNLASGAPAGAVNVTRNILIGNHVLNGGYGNSNTIIGDNAVSGQISAFVGDNNTAIGSYAMSESIAGLNNVAIGYEAGLGLGEGSYNTFIAGDCNTDVDGVVAIGKDSVGSYATATADNQFILGVATHRYQMPGRLETDLQIGASGGANKALRLFDSGESHSVGLKAPSSLGASTTYTLPAAYGTTGQVLQATDNSGTLGWTSVVAGVSSVNGQTGAVTVQTLVHPTTGSTFEYNTANVGMTGQNNTAIGVGAGIALTTGFSNTLLGYHAGNSLVDGYVNVAIGVDALASAVSSSNNVAVGQSSLTALTTGSDNVAIGGSSQAYQLTSGSANTIINSSTAGFTSGSQNTILGGAIGSPISGSVAIGRSTTAIASVSANNQFVLGVSDHRYYMAGRFESDISIGALSGATKSLKFFNGAEDHYVAFKADAATSASTTYTLPLTDGAAGQSLLTSGGGVLSWGAAAGSLAHPTTGSTFELGTNNVGMSGVDNTAIGVSAGAVITTGAYNTLFGKQAGQAITTGAYNTLIGWAAGESIVDGGDNVAIGADTLSGLTTGSYNVAICGGSGINITSGSYNTFINGDVNASGSFSGVVAIGADSSGATAQASASDQFVLGTANHKYRLPGIVETSLVLGPTGALAGETGIIQFRELAANGSNYVALRAADDLAASVIYTLPATNGTNGQVLTTTVGGALSWQTVVDTALTARVDKLEASRGIYSGSLISGSTLNISGLVPTGAVEYPIVQVYKVESGVNLQINVEFSFDPATKVITFGTIVDAPISAVIHVLALTEPLTTLV